MNVRAFRFKLLYSIFFLFFGGIVLFFLNTFLFVRKGVPASYKQSLFRRNKIDWPSDCEYSTRSKDLVAEKIKLPAEVCTDAIDSLQSELPKDCEYNNVALGEDGKIDLYRYRDFLGRAPIRFFSLGKGEFLGELLCDATAYNENRIYFLYDERTIPAKTKLLKFIAYEFSWNRNDEASEKIRMKRLESDRWIRYYKPETKEWIAFFKFRGMGDCGTYFRYQPSEQNLPVLVEIRAKLECDGTEAYSADEVPITWKQYEVPFDWKE